MRSTIGGTTGCAALFAPDVAGADVALGLSGAIGWVAVACLAVNLWRTFRQSI